LGAGTGADNLYGGLGLVPCDGGAGNRLNLRGVTATSCLEKRVMTLGGGRGSDGLDGGAGN